VDLSGVLEAIARIAEIEAAGQQAPAGFAPLLELVAPELGSPQALAASPQAPEAVPQPAVGGSWVEALPPQGRRFAGAIERAARAAGLDPRLLAALVWTESGFRADAISDAGAIGLTQLMPSTAAGLGVDPHDPVQNLEGGARYLAAQIRRFGSLELGLAAYVAGPGAVSAAGGIPSANAGAYVRRVLEHLADLGGDPAAVGAVGARASVGAAGRPAAGMVVGGPAPALADGAPPAPRPGGDPAAPVGGSRLADASGTGDVTVPGLELRAERTPAGESRNREAGARADDLGFDLRGVLHRPHQGEVISPPAPFDPPAGHVGGPSAVGRVLEVLERIRDQAPPRQVVVELPEMDGLRVLVEARASTVHVRPVGGDPSGVWYEALVRDLGPGLAARGFDLAGDPSGGGPFRGRPGAEDPWTPAAPPAAPAVRIRSEGVRL
jgi:hypothetical protein